MGAATRPGDHKRRIAYGMDRTLALLVATVAGAVIAAQAPTNGALGREIGGIRAALVNFAVGGVVLLVIVLVSQGDLSGITSDPHRWHYLGGLAGAMFVTAAIVTIAPLGATTQTAAIITGQLSASVVIDRFGLLGVEPRPIGLMHLIGIALLAAGVAVIARA
jgi:bacterial/archaeal transporter family-2 protein